MIFGSDFRKILYVGGAIGTVISLLLVGRTVFQVIPAIGFAGAAFYLGMSVFFLCVSIGLIFYARHDAKKEAAQRAAEELDQQ